MAENKKSFVAYCDWLETFDELSDEEAGKLVKHLFRYVNDLNPTSDRMTELIFIQFRQVLKRDLKKYESFIEKQKFNGAKGGRPKNPVKPKQIEKTQKTQPFISKPKKPVNVNVNDNVNVNEEEEEKDEKTSTTKFDNDSFYDIRHLVNPYLKNPKVISAVINHKPNGFKDFEHLKIQLNEFVSFRISEGETMKTPSDFASHFRRWNARKYKISRTHTDDNGQNMSDRIPIG